LWRDGLYVPMSMDPAVYTPEMSGRLVLSPESR
jgi:hypothetical protein